MTFAFGPRARNLLIVCVLALAAAGAGLMVLGRMQSSSSAAPKKPQPSTPRRTPAPAARSTVPAPAPTPTGDASAPQASPNSLPAGIAAALAANRIVVVSLFDPAAKIDGTAMREASAGAQLAGASFVPVDVTTNEVDVLNARYGVIQDPAVLVLRPPGDLVVRIDGFADRETVAQAAANAAT